MLKDYVEKNRVLRKVGAFKEEIRRVKETPTNERNVSDSEIDYAVGRLDTLYNNLLNMRVDKRE